MATGIDMNFLYRAVEIAVSVRRTNVDVRYQKRLCKVIRRWKLRKIGNWKSDAPSIQDRLRSRRKIRHVSCDKERCVGTSGVNCKARFGIGGGTQDDEQSSGDR